MNKPAPRRACSALALLAGCLVLPMLYGCVSVRATEVQQLAYDGAGPNPCLFGGVTVAADWHCQLVRRGLRGVLADVNRQVLDSLAADQRLARSCQLHVDRVRAALWQRPGLAVRSVFSCPPALHECHVSALVTDARGRQYVLDNGTVLRPALHADSVGELEDFERAVNGEYGFYPPIAGRQVKPEMARLERRQHGLRWEMRLRELPQLKRR